MSKQRTQGEWHKTKIASPDYAPSFGIYAGDSPTALAVVSGDNAEADATLIAAAPALLIALVELLASCESAVGWCDARSVDTSAAPDEDKVSAAYAAIKQATLP